MKNPPVDATDQIISPLDKKLKKFIYRELQALLVKLFDRLLRATRVNPNTYCK